uniref:hypothetical protein n=1 Tax=Lentzea kentuckyensis TaxID=360086 RepID=UPI001302C9EB
DAGYTGVATDHGSVNGTDRLEVRAAGSDPTHSTDEIARLVWETYPQRLDQVSITLNESHEVYSEDDLRATFGERGVSEKAAGDVGRTIVTWLIVGAVVLLLCLAGLTFLIVFLVRRSRHRALPSQYPPPGWSP